MSPARSRIRQAAYLRGLDRTACRPFVAAEQVRDGAFAFLGLKRTGAIDQVPPGLSQRHRVVEQAALQGGQLRQVASPPSARECRDGGGWYRSTMQGASSRMASNGPPFHTAASAVTISACRPSRVKFSRQAPQPRRGTVDGRDVRARPAQAARSFRPARRKGRRRTFRPRRRAGASASCSRVLHPPFALIKTGQRGDRAMRDQSHAAVRHHAAAELFAPSPSASLFTVRSSAGSLTFAAAIARAVSSP